MSAKEGNLTKKVLESVGHQGLQQSRRQTQSLWEQGGPLPKVVGRAAMVIFLVLLCCLCVPTSLLCHWCSLDDPEPTPCQSLSLEEPREQRDAPKQICTIFLHQHSPSPFSCAGCIAFPPQSPEQVAHHTRKLFTNTHTSNTRPLGNLLSSSGSLRPRITPYEKGALGGGLGVLPPPDLDFLSGIP